MFKVLTIEELAEDAFIKAENVKALEMMNAPTDFAKRKEAFVAMALARAAAREAEDRLTNVINKGHQPSIWHARSARLVISTPGQSQRDDL